MYLRSVLTVVASFALSSPALAGDVAIPNTLEPCLNGQVSASGRYPTQAIEDAVLAAAGGSLEACLNGEVSSDGLYPSEAMKRQLLGS